MRTAAYVYTGWHPIPERDASFHPGFTEWELVRNCAPRFDGHAQPKVPLLGEYDDRDPEQLGRRLTLARDHGVDAFVFGGGREAISATCVGGRWIESSSGAG